MNRLLYIFLFLTLNVSSVMSQKFKLGAYYFDGWTGAYPDHANNVLRQQFKERKPKWGWLTSTQSIVDKQINVASSNGISFFSFCWYFSGREKYKTEPLNNALGLFVNSKNTNKMSFSLLVANHDPYNVTMEDWKYLVTEWIKYFKCKNYVLVDGKPMISFFSMENLIKNFKTAKNLKSALDTFRVEAMRNGFKGITISVCVGPETFYTNFAQDSGFDFLTGYNYGRAGFNGNNVKRSVPIDSLQDAEIKVWNKFLTVSSLKYIPAVTVNWDPRPWANNKNNYLEKPYYTGFSELSVEKSVLNGLYWLSKNSNRTSTEKIAMIYAWNEVGEGAWLMPTKNGSNYSIGVRRALGNKK